MKSLYGTRSPWSERKTEATIRAYVRIGLDSVGSLPRGGIFSATSEEEPWYLNFLISSNGVAVN
jgi:hypothetical protein